MSISAQINLPKNNNIGNVKLKNNQYKDLKFFADGKQGFVYQDGNVGKKTPNAEIIFTSEDGTHTQKIKTNGYGRYKIRLKPTRYIVTVKYKSYKPYSTASGFSVVTKKFGTFNIPLKRVLKYPIKRKISN